MNDLSPLGILSVWTSREILFMVWQAPNYLWVMQPIKLLISQEQDTHRLAQESLVHLQPNWRKESAKSQGLVKCAKENETPNTIQQRTRWLAWAMLLFEYFQIYTFISSSKPGHLAVLPISCATIKSSSINIPNKVRRMIGSGWALKEHWWLLTKNEESFLVCKVFHSFVSKHPLERS